MLGSIVRGMGVNDKGRKFGTDLESKCREVCKDELDRSFKYGRKVLLSEIRKKLGSGVEDKCMTTYRATYKRQIF